MSVAYLDTSAVVAIALEEEGGYEVIPRLRQFSRLLSSNLLEAELRATLFRERVSFDTNILSGMSWVMPNRPIGAECMLALRQGGLLRGADLWHVATALYVSPDPREVAFISLDKKQLAVAGRLGFQI